MRILIYIIGIFHCVTKGLTSLTFHFSSSVFVAITSIYGIEILTYFALLIFAISNVRLIYDIHVGNIISKK